MSKPARIPARRPKNSGRRRAPWRWRALERLGRYCRFGDDEFGRDDKLAQGFKPDAIAIEEAPVPVSAHAALYIVVSLLVIAILWAIFGSLDRIVVAQGKIATRTPMLVMQPFITSRILAINVTAGDHVHKGQVLVKFDPAFAQADVASLQNKVESLTAQSGAAGRRTWRRTKFTLAKPGDSPERFTQAADLQPGNVRLSGGE